jgi:hypothetical protein
MIDGTVTQAATEIPLAIQNFRDQADYTLGDAATNILMGGLISGGIHLGVEALGRAFSKIRAATPETREVMFREALQQALKDEDVRVHDYVNIDERAIEAKVREDLRAEAEKAFPESVQKEGTSRRAFLSLLGKAIGAAGVPVNPAKIAAKVLESPAAAAAVKLELPDISITKLMEIAHGDDWHFAANSTVPTGFPIDERVQAAANLVSGLEERAQKTRSAMLAKGIPENRIATGQDWENYSLRMLQDKGVFSPEEVAKILDDFKEEIAAAAIVAPVKEHATQATQATQLTRQQNIDKFVADNLPSRVETAKRAEILEQVKQGKILPDEEVRKWVPEDQEKFKAAVDESAAEVEAEVKSMIEELGDEAVDALEKLKIKVDPGVGSGAQIVPYLWNGAINATQMAIRAGVEVGKAIEEGAKFIYENWNKHIDKIEKESKGDGAKAKEDTRRDFIKKLGLALAGTQVPFTSLAPTTFTAKNVLEQLGRYSLNDFVREIGSLPIGIGVQKNQKLTAVTKKIIDRYNKKEHGGKLSPEDLDSYAESVADEDFHDLVDMGWATKKDIAEIANALPDIVPMIQSTWKQMDLEYARQQVLDEALKKNPEYKRISDEREKLIDDWMAEKTNLSTEEFHAKENELLVKMREIRKEVEVGLTKQVQESSKQISEPTDQEIADAVAGHFRESVKSEIKRLEDARKQELKDLKEEIKSAQEQIPDKESIAAALDCLIR